MTTDTLERRLARLEAKDAIAQTIYRYARSIDYGQQDDWLDCFVDDGVFEVRSPVASTLVFAGRAELTRMVHGHTKAPERWHKHIVTQIDAQPSGGDDAISHAYILRVDRDDDDRNVPKIWVFGQYLDKLRLCSDGKWRFTHRVIELEGINPDQVPGLRELHSASRGAPPNLES